MRILLVSGSLPTAACGVGDYTDSLAKSLAQIPGNVVAVLTGSNSSASGGRPYEVLRPICSWRLREAAAALRAIRQWRPDVVHIQYPTQGYGKGLLSSLIGLVAMCAGVRVIRTWHEPFPRSQLKSFIAQFSAPGPYIVVRSNFDELMWRPLRLMLKFRTKSLIQSASSIPQSELSPVQLEKLRRNLLGGADRLIVFFGFLLPSKGVELVFEAANPASDRILIVGDEHTDPAYTADIRALAESEQWRQRVTITGFLPPSAIADQLAAADVVILPFRAGGGSWNSSIHAAVSQGTPVVTTTAAAPITRGLVRYVAVDDVSAMARAVDAVPAWSLDRIDQRPGSDWERVARQHMEVYGAMLSNSHA